MPTTGRPTRRSYVLPDEPELRERIEQRIVGTHGHGGIAAALLGSVARGLCHSAHCPVLVVPPPRSSEQPELERETMHAA